MATRVPANMMTGQCSQTGLPCRVLANLTAAGLNQHQVLTRTIATGSLKLQALVYDTFLRSQNFQEASTRILANTLAGWFHRDQPRVLLQFRAILSPLTTNSNLEWKVRKW